MSVSSQLRLLIPALAALVLLVLSAAPLTLSAWPFTPHVVWLLSLTLGVMAPAAWPVITAFALGLVSDVLLGTPLGLQALLSVLLVLRLQAQARRLGHQPFRIRWLEASLMLLVLYILSWAAMGLVAYQPPLLAVLLAAIANMLWYPVFYLMGAQLARLSGAAE